MSCCVCEQGLDGALWVAEFFIRVICTSGFGRGGAEPGCVHADVGLVAAVCP